RGNRIHGLRSAVVIAVDGLRNLVGGLLGSAVAPGNGGGALVHLASHGLAATARGLTAKRLFDRVLPGLDVEQLCVRRALPRRKPEQRVVGLYAGRVDRRAAPARHQAARATGVERARPGKRATGTTAGMAAKDEHRPGAK